jgi:hypothetical protein
MADMPRWSADQVFALAPDTSSLKAGRGLGTAQPWRDTGTGEDPASLWGLCQGSGAKPYQTCIDLTEPAYQCSCPSRKFPCKHAIGLLLLWSGGGVAPAEPPAWVVEWHAARAERKETAAVRAARPTPATSSTATRERRRQRVDAGVAELERWLTDQVRPGIAGASRAGYQHWDAMAGRLVDAQAPGLASAVRRLAGVAGAPDRLLAELGLIWLLVRGYGRLDDLPPDLSATVRSRIGFPVATEEVLAGPRVRDDWAVIGVRDEADDRLTIRRVWLHGHQTGRPALVLSFAAPGQPLPADLVLGSSVAADLCFYPGRLPLRALVAQRYGEPVPAGVPAGAGLTEALDSYAAALAAEPWLDRWPMVLRTAIVVRDPAHRWHLVDPDGVSLGLDPAGGDPWRLVAAAGGAPTTIAGEWSQAGLRALAAWSDGQLVRL